MSLGTLTVGSIHLQVLETHGKPTALRVKAGLQGVKPLVEIAKGSNVTAKFHDGTPPSGKYLVSDYYTQFDSDGGTTWNLVLRYQGK